MNISDCNILVVDDTESYIDQIVGTLDKSFDISVATNGQTAIEYIRENPPDLILLDILMPEMDGYEVCKILKSDEKTKDIPIIFLTAMSQEMDEAKGLALGAVDYVIKPFNPEIVKARIKNQLLLKLQRDELAKQNEILIENARLKEDIEAITRHDLKAPLNGILGFPDLVLSGAELSDKHRGFLESTIECGKKMLNMINMSLDLYKMEQGTYEVIVNSIDIIPIIKDVIEENDRYIKRKKLDVKFLINTEELSNEIEFNVMGEELLFYSMFSNLFKNAIEASANGDQVLIRLTQNKEKRIEIKNAQPVPEGIKENFFNKYVTAGKKAGTGLGTYSARLITETLGGTIHMDSSENSGTKITLQF
jgi:two-component system, sensor histidine kinase and response regulator